MNHYICKGLNIRACDDCHDPYNSKPPQTAVYQPQSVVRQRHN